MTKIGSTLLGLLGFALLVPLSAQEPKLTDSGNSLSGHPPELVMDGDGESWFGLNPQFNEGWIKMEWDAPLTIERVGISGEWPKGSLITLCQEREGVAHALPGGLVMGPGKEARLDLTPYSERADNLIVHIRTENPEALKIREIGIETTREETPLSPVPLRPRSPSLFPRGLNPSDFLTDGKIGTVWFNTMEGFGERIGWLQGDSVKKAYHLEQVRKTEDLIILETEEPTRPAFLKYYATSESAGRMALELETEEGLFSVGEYPLAGQEGWRKIPLPEERKITALRLTLSDPSRPDAPGRYGGLGEVELWTDSPPAGPLPADLPARREILFSGETLAGGERTLLITTAKKEGNGPATVKLNGFGLQKKRQRDYEDYLIHEYPLRSDKIAPGPNTLTIGINDEDSLLSAHMVRTPAPGWELDVPALSDGRRFSGNSAFIRPLTLHPRAGRLHCEEIRLYYRGNCPEGLLVSSGEERIPITPREEGKGRAVCTYTGLLEELTIETPGALQEVEIIGSPHRPAEPMAEIIFPPQGALLPAGEIEGYKVRGVTDLARGRLLINGEAVTRKGPFFQWDPRRFGLSPRGEITLNLEIITPEGRRFTQKRTFTVEEEPVRLWVADEHELIYTDGESYRVTGEARGPSNRLIVNNRRVERDSAGRFFTVLPLEPGLNTIGIDYMGRSARVQVYRRREERELTMTSPVPGSVTGGDTLPVSGRVSPWGLEKVTVNGAEAVIENGRFHCPSIPPLKEGANAITLRARYQSGRRISRTFYLIRDSSPPRLTGLKPRPNGLEGQDYAVITGRVEDTQGCSLWANGILAALNGRFFSVEIPLPREGENPVVLTARDSAGNRTVLKPFNIIRDTRGPEDLALSLSQSGWSRENRPVLTFDGGEDLSGIDRFEVFLNSRFLGEQTSPFRLPRLDEGENIITVRSYDRLGNFTDASVIALVDTLPPEPPGHLKVVPGKDSLIIKWEAPDSRIAYYEIEELSTHHIWKIDRTGSQAMETILPGLIPGKEYPLSITTTDKAGNVGRPLFFTGIPGEARQEVVPGERTLVEYDRVALSLPPEPAGTVRALRIGERESDLLRERSLQPIVSPLYSFTAEDETGLELSHTAFAHPFSAVIAYEESRIPQGIPEELLAVHYYDEIWGRWIPVGYNRVDTETNRVYFATDHFTDFSLQPLLSAPTDYGEWDNIDYPLGDGEIRHAPLSISPAGGGLTTAMTEIVLPGLNGQDLALRRVYSSAVADRDSRDHPLNRLFVSAMLSEAPPELDIGPDGLLIAEGPLDQKARSLLADYNENYRKEEGWWAGSAYGEFLKKRGENAYALGQGWRLDLPYVQFTGGEASLYLPGKGFLLTREMASDIRGTEVVFTDSLEGRGVIRAQRERVIEDRRGIIRQGTSLGEGERFIHRLMGITAETPDGLTYRFTADGRIQSVLHPYGTGIHYTYDDRGRLTKITDTKERVLFFMYQGPYRLTGIALYDKITAPAGEALTPEEFARAPHKISYTYREEPETGYLPLLDTATDIQGRLWTYQYGTVFLHSRSAGGEETEADPLRTRADFAFPLISYSGPGAGWERVTYGKSWSAGTEDLSALELRLAFPGEESLALQKRMRELLAVSRVDSFDETGQIIKTTRFSYRFDREGRIEKSVWDDGRLKTERLYHIRAYGVDKQGDRGRYSYRFESPLESRMNTYLYRDGIPILEETRETSYHKDRPLIRRRVTTGGTTTYAYDAYGNITVIDEEEHNRLYTARRTVYRWFDSAPPLPEGLSPSPSPLDESDFGGHDIRDRLRRELTVSTVSGDVERIEPIQESVYGYDEQGSLVARADLTESGWSISRWVYDNSGRLIESTGPLGLVTTYGYGHDRTGREILTVTEKDIPDEEGNPSDRVWERTLHGLRGDLLRERKPDGTLWITERDALGRITLSQPPAEAGEDTPPRTNVSYDDQKGVVTVKDPQGVLTRFRYDSRSRLTALESVQSDGTLLRSTTVTRDGNGNIIEIITPEGNQRFYRYDGLNRLIEERLPGEEEKITRHTYRLGENRDEEVNSQGAVTENVRNIRGRIIEKTEAAGTALSRKTRAVYSLDGRLLASHDARGNVTNYFYDCAGHLCQTRHPRASFSPAGEAARPGDLRETREFNARGQVVRESACLRGEAPHYEKTYSYDKAGRLIEERDSYGVVRYGYDRLDRMTKRTDEEGRLWTTEYSRRGQIVGETNPRGASTRYGYDKMDRRISYTDPLGATMTYGYDSLGRLIEGNFSLREGETDRRIQLIYDREDNLIARIEADGERTDYTYTARNRIGSETRGGLYRTEMTYDAEDRLIKKTLPGGAAETYRYDLLGRMTLAALPEGVTHRYGYDSSDNRIRTIDGENREERYVYDSLNRLRERIDRGGRSWRTDYDGAGRPTRTEYPDGSVLKRRYDQRGALAEETNRRGLVTAYTYCPTGGVRTVTDPRGTVTTYTYREDNLPATVTLVNEREGRRRDLTYAYDDAGRLIGGTDGGVTTRYRRDPMGQITSRVTQGFGSLTIGYDNRDRIVSEKTDTHPAVTYEYDRLNRLTSVSGLASDFTYDPRGNLESLSLANGMVRTGRFDDQDRLIRLDYHGGDENLKHYDFRWDRESNLTEKNDNTYLYDELNRLTTAMVGREDSSQREEPVDLARFGERKILGSANDVIGQEDFTEEALSPKDFQIDWDARSIGVDMGYPYYVGRIILHLGEESKSHRVKEEDLTIYTSLSHRGESFSAIPIKTYKDSPAEGTITVILSEPTAARYIKIQCRFNERDGDYEPINQATLALDRENPITVMQLAGGGRNEFYTYDKTGNRSSRTLMEGEIHTQPYAYQPGSDLLISDGRYEYSYDDGGNLIEKKSLDRTAGGHWKYRYDLRNRLEQVEKYDPAMNRFETVASYLYDIEGNRIGKKDQNGKDSVYIFDLGGNIIEERTENGSMRYVFMGNTPLARINQNGSTHYLGTDHLNTLTLVTDESGRIVQEGEASPFGDQENKNLLFTGKGWDQDAGLYYFNARWYDPDTGRFITEDPARDGENWYAYCAGNPMSYVDPTGKAIEIGNGLLYNDKNDTYYFNDGRDVKEETRLTITRSAVREDQNDTAELTVGGMVLDRYYGVQSEKNYQSKKQLPHERHLNDYSTEDKPFATLPVGEDYQLTLIGNTASYTNVLSITSRTAHLPKYKEKGIKGTKDGWYFLIHPTGSNKNKERENAYSLGCQIFHNQDFNKLMTLIDEIGYEKGDVFNMTIKQQNFIEKENQ